MLDSKQLIDSRDNKTYWVTKLKDGNCWMTQNLDYDGGGKKISAPSGWTTGSSQAVDSGTAAWYDPGNYYYTDPTKWTACSNNSTGLSACTSNGWTTSGDAHYHAGNYYSWEAAKTVCPRGWYLPTSADNGEFSLLLSGVNQTDIRKAPYYFIPGGDVNSGTLNYAGERGYYWSSTAYNSDRAYYLYFSSGGVNPSNNWDRYRGFSVRCLVSGS